VEVVCGDFSFASLADRLLALTPKSGAGLWMSPFRGIPATNVTVPLDLIYLDSDCRVIEAVEFFPTFRVPPSSPLPASVLALPAHSIFASHTQPGDQLVFGRAEDIDRQLEQFFGGGSGRTVQETSVAREELRVSTPPALPSPEVRPIEQPTAPQPGAPQPEPWKKETAKKSWLKRLLSPDPPEPRKAFRAALPDLAAYFWTGGAPKAHPIRDISSTGLYVLTDERWYLGTLVQMTLKKSDGSARKAEVSISVLAKANRWGNDGVGLGFVVRDPRGGDTDQAGAIDREELDRFLERIKPGNG
jgi:hypothetical protein